MEEKRNCGISISSPCFLLFIVFLVLKLTRVITWSWLWVTAPLWIPLALVFSIFIITLIVILIIHLFTRY